MGALVAGIIRTSFIHAGSEGKPAKAPRESKLLKRVREIQAASKEKEEELAKASAPTPKDAAVPAKAAAKQRPAKKAKVTFADDVPAGIPAAEVAPTIVPAADQASTVVPAADQVPTVIPACALVAPPPGSSPATRRAQGSASPRELAASAPATPGGSDLDNMRPDICLCVCLCVPPCREGGGLGWRAVSMVVV